MLERTNYPCTLSVDDQGEGFLLSVQVAAGVDGERVCGYMQTALIQLVEALESSADVAVRDLALLPQTELQQLLETFNPGVTAYPADQTIASRFEAQVLANADALAVVHGEQSLTYAELNRQANQLAHHLRTLDALPISTLWLA